MWLAGGFGLDLAREHEQVVFDVAVEGRIGHRLPGPFAIGMGLHVVVPVVRDQFFYTDATGAQYDLFKMSPVAAVLDAALAAELP